MKQKIGILLLMLTFAVTLSTECKQDTVLHSPQITLEQVEAFKVDDSEFKSAVATKSSFGSEKNEAGLGLIGFLISHAQPHHLIIKKTPSTPQKLACSGP